MIDTDRNLRENLRKESDELIFQGMELSEQMKQAIREQAAADRTVRRSGRGIRRSWLIGAAAMVAAVMIVAGYPLLQQQGAEPAPIENQIGDTPPANDGAVGSDLSELVTTTLGSVEEAQAAFGADLMLPASAPEGYVVTEIVAVGAKGQPARDVVVTYASGDDAVTFVASRSPAAFPTELFTPIQVGDRDGFVFEQAELVELFWIVDGVQYAITGPLTADEAVSLAESLS
jgi:hypothetical protein